MGRLAKAALALLAVMIGAFAALSAYTVIWDRRHPMTGGGGGASPVF
jgi:predicted exporter